MTTDPAKEPKLESAKEEAKSSPSAINQILKIAYFILSSPFWLTAAILKKINRAYLTPISIILASLMVSASIILASLIISLSISPTDNSNQSQKSASPTAQSGKSASASQSQNLNPEVLSDQVKLNQTDKIRGNKSNRYILVEYSDLECPFCKKLHPDLKKLTAEFSNLSWAYRHFPLDSSHPKARKEAEAAECAAEIGGTDAFWRFIDKVFEITPSNNGLDPDQLPQIASQIGLDGTKLQSCIDSGRMSSIVETQYQSGLKAGINGTPGTFILDTKTGKSTLVTGAIPYEDFKTQLNTFISQAGK